jgi:acyl-coenzyme A thioesterase PaaI-like protein
VDIAGYATVAIWHEAPTPTTALHVEYLRPAVGNELLARGILRRMGRTIARADIEVSAADTLVALGRATYSTFEMRE